MAFYLKDVGRGCEDSRDIYKYYSGGQGEHRIAKIFTHGDGSIDEDGTYNEWYLKKHGLGSFAKKSR